MPGGRDEGTGRPGPLDGVLVVDLATPRAELAGRILADLGAEVLKIEPPEGAAARRLPPFERGREGDPEGSLYWAAVALGKRSIVLDLRDESGRERLRGLLSDADVLVESFDPGTLAALGLDYEALRELHPGLIHASVTPFGVDGPEAATPANELTLEAAGGLLGLQGDGDRPPIPVGFPQAAFHAGAQAAADIVVALHERLASGRGQHLDVSMQAAIVWTLMNATGYPPMTGGNSPGTSEFRADPRPGLVPGLRLPNIAECREGFALVAFGLPVVGERTLHGLAHRAEVAGALPAEVCGRDWSHWIADLVGEQTSAEHVQLVVDAVCAFLRTRTKAELQTFAVEDSLLLAPAYDVADLLADRQLAAREYWTRVGGRVHPGPFAKLSETPVQLRRPAPALGEAQSLLEKTRSRPAPVGLDRRSQERGDGAGAFAGLKVADFAWVGVGPMISKALGDHGATVVHVESEARLDVLRQLPPFRDSEPGINRSHFVANFNTSKLGLALDLGTDGGRELARRLVDWADVVLESFTPGTMKKWGLDYSSLAVDRPELVMLSTCLRGQDGPEAPYAGFGGQGAALAGLWAITGWPDRPPSGPWGAFTDFICPRFGVAALAAALVHRARTGRGQHIDFAQVEGGIRFIEPLVLDHIVNGRVAGAIGHDSFRACPHGVYATAGTERYIAIGVETASEWRGLRSQAPLDEFAADAFDSIAARRVQRAAIEARLRDWCRDQDGFELASRLQVAGVPAYMVMRPTDLYENAQLAHREFFVTLDHAEMGPTPFDGPVTRFSRTPARLSRAAPCLGQHTHEVLREILGVDEEATTAYAIAGALT